MYHHPNRLFLLALMLFTGCLTRQPAVTKEEALAFAKTLEAAMKERNPTLFNNIFDPETFKSRIKIASDGKLSDKTLDDIPSIIKKKRMGDELQQSMGKDGTYQMVKNYEKDGKQHVIFRLYGSAGLNYQDIELVHSGKEVKAADMYIYLTGENLSKSFADIYTQLIDYAKTSSDEHNIVKTITDLKSNMAQEHYQKALTVFESLPDTLKKQKLFQIYHVQITGQLQDTLYQGAIEEFEKLFPNERGMFLLFFNVHVLHKEYTQALTDVNKMDSLLNKDLFLDFYRGYVYRLMNKDSTAEGYYEKLYKNMPTFGDGLAELIALYAKNGDKEKANSWAKVYKDNKKFNQQSLEYLDVIYPWLETK